MSGRRVGEDNQMHQRQEEALLPHPLPRHPILPVEAYLDNWVGAVTPPALSPQSLPQPASDSVCRALPEPKPSCGPCLAPEPAPH